MIHWGDGRGGQLYVMTAPSLYMHSTCVHIIIICGWSASKMVVSEMMPGSMLRTLSLFRGMRNNSNYTNLFLDIFYFLIMLVRSTVKGKHQPVSCKHKQIIDDRSWHQKKDNKDPSVVDQDVFQASVFVPGI